MLENENYSAAFRQMYGDMMEALKQDNREYLEVLASKPYTMGKKLSTLQKNLAHPGIMLQKVRWNRQEKCLNRTYPPRMGTAQVLPANYFSKQRIAVYTVITGGYDGVQEPRWRPDNCDFYLITDHPETVREDSVWKGIEIASCLPAQSSFDNAAKNRYCKMMPYRLPSLENYAFSLYVDGNVQIISDPTECINRIGAAGMALHRHSSRDCAYIEAVACVMAGKASKEEMDRQAAHLHAEHLPEQYGLAECNVIARAHDNTRMRKTMECWWQEYCAFAKRDQLSFPLALYQNEIPMAQVALLGENVFQNAAFRVIRHPKGKI